ncbi:MAG: regulatory iron-sulfur-containing complex subunit RicT [Phycisphaerales bacterium]
MPIHALPQFEADLAEHLAEQADREAYERLNVPTTLVVRFGFMRLVGEFPYRGDAKPGCGSKIVVRTHRGHEIGEMLTSTCPNAGCSKSVTRKQMLEYIENSGGRDYPFFNKGLALRVATGEDLDRQARIEQSKHELRTICKAIVEKRTLPIKIVDVEPILGGERTTVYYTTEERFEPRDLARELSSAIDQRVELRQVGARDEARITADYERCGQYCCCKSFLKVLKPISMKSAKTQKATLDPLKISGRCGRLMCCLRYEDETYEELRRRLPRRKARVGTPEGDGVVVDAQILTQLVLVQLDSGQRVAIPVEELGEPGMTPTRAPAREERPRRPERARREKRPERAPRPDREETVAEPRPDEDVEGAPKKKRRRRRRKRPDDAQSRSESRPESTDEPRGESRQSRESGQPDRGEGAPRKKKRRRKRRRRPDGGSGPSDSGASPPAS